MTKQEAIEILEEVKELDDTMYAYNPAYMNALDMAIEALKEIQMYKGGKLLLVPTDVYSRQCSELDAYKEIGTVEECRECAGDCRDGGSGNMILTFILGLIGGAAAGVAVMALVAMAKDKED